MTIIENEFLKVSIRNQGAELTSIVNKANNKELLWQADPAVWAWHAPNLFPIVGGLINNELMVDGESFQMPRHGFTRQSDMLLLEAEKTYAKFSLIYTDETLQVFPYKFDLQINYDLIDNALRVTYKVINLDNKTIYFSVGGHPAFNVPFSAAEKYEDYYIEFEVDEKLETHLLSPEGFFNGQTKPVMLKDKKLYLTHDLFANDALVLKNLKSREVCIKNTLNDESVSIEFPHFNHLGIWAKSGANFLCIEPWLGLADTQDKHVDISQKEGIQKLKLGHVFEESFFISI